MTQVDAPTRLHFGLLHVPDEGTKPDERIRRFGGLGLMLSQPRVTVQVKKSHMWSGEGPSAERALAFARRAVGTSIERFHVRIVACPPEHVGLGVGTQLGLATTTAIRAALGEPKDDAVALAIRAGRGERSAIGIHGFRSGGLIVDAGKMLGARLGTLAGRCDFPLEWPVVLMRPRLDAAWFGQREKLAFQRTRVVEWSDIDSMCRLIWLGIVPAVLDRDYASFSEHLFEYNRAAGLPFREDQRGVYAGPEMERIIELARAVGVQAVGQSSWGPTAFAICESEEAASRLRERLRVVEPECETTCTTTDNRGAVLLQDAEHRDGEHIRGEHEQRSDHNG